MSRVAIHRLDRDGVVARLREWAQSDLARRPGVAKVVLIGSLARGDWSARSDADVVIVVDSSDEAFRHRAGNNAPSSSLGIDLDLFVYTEVERRSWGPRFRREVERGETLWERDP